ncbi:hypothetical protein ACFE04_026240 [Oxalis oulophora]
MACSSVTIPISTPVRNNVFQEHDGLRRSQSNTDIRNCNRPVIQRCKSDNHLCYSVNRVWASSAQPKLENNRSGGIFPFQISSSMIPNTLRSFLFDPETSKNMSLLEKTIEIDENSEESSDDEKIKRANWLLRIWQVRHNWKKRQQEKNDVNEEELYDEEEEKDGDCDDGGNCGVSYGSEDEEEEIEVKYDSDSFSRLLAHVPLSDTKEFSKLAFLSNMAYVIQEIKKAAVVESETKLDQDSTRIPISPSKTTKSNSDSVMEIRQNHPDRSSLGHEIAASAASYVHSLAKEENNICSKATRERVEEHNSPRLHKSEVAAIVAASTMTAVVAAGEKEKEEAAKDLQSLHSSPCEWFICDDSNTYTRCFVIQGSDSSASWQANLLFEPTKFEGTDVLVHRGIYEAAKGLYKQFLPEIMDHLNAYGERAKFQFTGHSLGGSLSLLIHLMLLSRKVVKPSALRPIVTFGSPFVFCGGHKILNYLGLDESDIHAVIMHRDIVPRAFACNYPSHIALLLKRLNRSLRSHPCLNKNKLLYTPLGKIFILQPNQKSSPQHPLLPPGNCLYALDKSQCGFSAGALKAFLNNPHPLETLSHPSAYGSDGTILRDHDSSNYLKAVNGVLRQHTKKLVREVRKQRNLVWPLLTSPSPHLWGNESNLDSSRLLAKDNGRLSNQEVMTRV